jgi:dipeptidyl aminopeptidase/acylaminoacyl peptidase
MTDLEVWTAERPGYLASIAQAHGVDTARATTALHDISPIHHIEAFSKIPIFLLHGEADQTVPVHHSRDFAAALKSIGGNVVCHEVPGVGHDDGIATDWQEEIFTFIKNTGTCKT